jgi:hypothetical protein
LFLEGDAVCFAGGSIYQTARFDRKTGRCLNEPVHTVGSQYGTAFYPYYPEYGQYVSLDHRLADGRRLVYLAAYEGSQHTPLAMFAPPKPGAPERPAARKFEFGRPAGPRAEPIWQLRPAPRFNGFVVGQDAVAAAGQRASDGRPKPFVAAIRLADGADLWRDELPAPAVRGGAAIDHTGRLFVSLDDGRLVCYGPSE